MLKNDTLKNGTSRIGLYGSAPPPGRSSNNERTVRYIMKTQKLISDCKMVWKGQDIRKCLIYGFFTQLDTTIFQLFLSSRHCYISLHNTKLLYLNLLSKI